MIRGTYHHISLYDPYVSPSMIWGCRFSGLWVAEAQVAAPPRLQPFVRIYMGVVPKVLVKKGLLGLHFIEWGS